jgi:hypothetical protein
MYIFNKIIMVTFFLVILKRSFIRSLIVIPCPPRGVINGKTSYPNIQISTLTLSQPEGADCGHHIGFLLPKKSRCYAPAPII